MNVLSFVNDKTEDLAFIQVAVIGLDRKNNKICIVYVLSSISGTPNIKPINAKAKEGTAKKTTIHSLTVVLKYNY